MATNSKDHRAVRRKMPYPTHSAFYIPDVRPGSYARWLSMHSCLRVRLHIDPTIFPNQTSCVADYAPGSLPSKHLISDEPTMRGPDPTGSGGENAVTNEVCPITVSSSLSLSSLRPIVQKERRHSYSHSQARQTRRSRQRTPYSRWLP